MSSVTLENAVLRGEITLPPSKSAMHRALICSFLAGGGTVENKAFSDDINATQAALDALKSGADTIDCCESGSTLRFLIPIAAALGKTVTFVGKGRLPQRPLDEYLRLLPEHGVACEYGGALPLSISGQLTAGRFELAGDVSSQYVTGLLLALPLLDCNSEIVLTSELQSKPYVDMTVEIMRDFGVTVNETESGYTVSGRQSYKKRDYRVESDWSQAAFFLVGGILGGDVTLKGLDMNSVQGDKKIVNVLRAFGADIREENGGIRAVKSDLTGCTVDVKNIPDATPAIAVAAAFAKGQTVITGGERLRLKESDRIESVVSNLRKMGVDAVETKDGMIINGTAPVGTELLGYNDHRIVMAFSVAALCAKGKTTISDALSINKSYPEFFNDYNTLGGKADVIGDR